MFIDSNNNIIIINPSTGYTQASQIVYNKTITNWY